VANNKKFVTEIETSITYLLFKKLKRKNKVNKQLICKQTQEKKKKPETETNKIFALTAAGVELYHRMIFRSDDALLRPLLSKRKKPAKYSQFTYCKQTAD